MTHKYQKTDDFNWYGNLFNRSIVDFSSRYQTDCVFVQTDSVFDKFVMAEGIGMTIQDEQEERDL